MTASSESAARRKLPIGIQTFRKIREDGYYYVDKTGLIGQLVDGGQHYFLSRPHERSGRRVVVLVDEYDKPILDALGTPEVARANRGFLHGLYSVIKACDAHVHFALLTGVSKFSNASPFSGLNNLMDITLDPRYSAICGYTERDLDEVFAPELPGLDRKEVRRW